MIEMNVDLSPALAELDGMAERAGKGVRSAAYRGAVLIREQAERNAPESKKAHWFYGRRQKSGSQKKYLFQPGSLKRAVFIAFADESSIDGERATYAVGWKTLSRSKGYVPYAHMVEFGTAKSPAKGFLRAAFDSKKRAAMAAMAARIAEVVKDGDD